MQRFEEFLQSRGGRITKQQRFIVEQVFQEHQHFDADELAQRLKPGEDGKKPGRATVYRVLNKLVEAGLLVKMDLAGRAVYEFDYGYPDHDHLNCAKCGKLIEFRSERIREICDAVAAEHRFRPTGHRLIVEGVCRECQQAAVRPKRRVDLI